MICQHGMTGDCPLCTARTGKLADELRQAFVEGAYWRDTSISHAFRSGDWGPTEPGAVEAEAARRYPVAAAAPPAETAQP